MSRNAMRFNKQATEMENMDKRDEREILDTWEDDEQAIRNTIDYQNMPRNQRNRAFGKRWNKANKPVRGGIRE